MAHLSTNLPPGLSNANLRIYSSVDQYAVQLLPGKSDYVVYPLYENPEGVAYVDFPIEAGNLQQTFNVSVSHLKCNQEKLKELVYLLLMRSFSLKISSLTKVVEGMKALVEQLKARFPIELYLTSRAFPI